MRATDLAVEAWRNVRSGAARASLGLAVLGPVVLGLAWLDMSQVAALRRAAIAYRDAGAATYVLSTDGQVDGARCEALGAVAGVSAAGAVRAVDPPFVPRVTPRTSIPQYEITPGLAVQLDPGYADGVALDALTAQSLGVVPGQWLPGTGGGAAVLHTYVYPDDGRDQGLAFALTRVGTVSGRYDRCWLALWPPEPAVAGALLRGTLTADADPAEVRVGQLNTRPGEEFDLPQQFVARTGRLAAPAALVLAAGIAFGVARLRRLELAFARHLGLRRVDVVALLVLEVAIVAAPATLAGAALTGAYAVSTGLDEVWVFGLRVLVFALPGAVAGAVLAGWSAREGRVLEYFTAR